jgi:phosphoribosylformylglycinamidine synthase PurS subunit
VTLIAKVHVTLKPGVNDPQGQAIRGGLHTLGFSGVAEVRAGRYFEVRLDAADRPSADAAVKEMCEKLLANTVIETYRYEVEPGGAAGEGGA